MSAQPNYRHYITEEEYLAAERQAEFKSEYLNGEVFAMAGASYEHNLITGNLVTSLNNRLGDRNCTVQANDMRLQVSEAGLYTYPDVSVVCGEPQFRDKAYLDTLLNPVVLVEVMSRSTKGFDRAGKLQFYRSIPSLRHYLLVASNAVNVMSYSRLEDDIWRIADYTGLTDLIPLTALDLELPVAEIYRKVPLPERSAQA
ncbi:Uma2 family endonuclease [Hymenobacter sp. ASUV-10]|uniref:Uma2 family endonuclease n=1 Tax=Hymenobacter aranciens TaxID=3063996 RepID=A0ABT9B6L6_9BACT|nr:Uma2 family endonuclease [Hymenobacter sp. ASUV-10]MDO7873860.1 Uma2 family endonuclease [Hymenobacter sp. ASUV-10]